jgi:hypothetical protein
MKTEEKTINGILFRETSYEESDLSTSEQKEEWLLICNSCEYKKEDSCRSCGCIVTNIMLLKESKCPEGKW